MNMSTYIHMDTRIYVYVLFDPYVVSSIWFIYILTFIIAATHAHIHT